MSFTDIAQNGNVSFTSETTPHPQSVADIYLCCYSFSFTGCYFHVCHLMVKGAEASYKRELQNAVDLSALCYIKACCSIRRCSAIKKYFLNLGASLNAALSRDGGQKCQIYVSFIKRQPVSAILQ